MQNFRKIQWIVIENFPDGRTDGRTRVNSKVPIPTKFGGPKMVKNGQKLPFLTFDPIFFKTSRDKAVHRYFHKDTLKI